MGRLVTRPAASDWSSYDLNRNELFVRLCRSRGITVIELHPYPSSLAITKELIDQGCNIGLYGNDILGRISFTKYLRHVHLVSLSDSDLGYPEGCTVIQARMAGLKLGYQLCEAEIAIHCLLQPMELTGSGLIVTAMRSVKDKFGHARVFVLYRSDFGSYLCGRRACLKVTNARWLFTRPQSLRVITSGSRCF